MFQKIDGLVERIKEELANGRTLTLVDDMGFSYEIYKVCNGTISIIIKVDGEEKVYVYEGDYFEINDGYYLNPNVINLLPIAAPDNVDILSPNIRFLYDDYSIYVKIY